VALELLSLARRPASTTRHHLAYDTSDMSAFSARLSAVPPHLREDLSSCSGALPARR
jgi:hypothetical protein